MKIRWWLLALQFGLGIVFVVASVTKLSAHSLFINEVLGYDLLPESLARIYAMMLPWVELFVGVSLILSIFTTTALVLSLLMALSFAIANIYALAQGIGDNCGNCFGQVIPLSLTTALTIDILMIAAVVLLLLFINRVAPLNIINLFLDRLASIIPNIPKRQNQKIGQVILLAVIILAVGLPLSLSEKTSPVYREIDNFLDQGRPVFLFFYLEGCGECEQQKPIIESLKQDFGEWLSFIRIDYKTGSGVVADFDVARVPTMLLVGDKTDIGYTVLQRFPDFTNKVTIRRSLYEKLGTTMCERYGPLAEFAAAPVSGNGPLKVQFTDLSMGDIWSWAWDFNNNDSVDNILQHPSHVFYNSGIYTVALTTSGPCGSSTEIKEDYLKIITSGCIADFSAEPTYVDGVKPIQFHDRSEGDVISWEWDFNDDGITDSIDRNPTYTYTTNGEYSVTLTIKTTDCEDIITKENYIKISGCSG